MTDNGPIDVDGNHEPPRDDEWGLSVTQDGKHRALRGITKAHKDAEVFQLNPEDIPGREESYLDRQSDLYPLPVPVTISETGQVVTGRAAEWLRLDGITWDVREVPRLTGGQ